MRTALYMAALAASRANPDMSTSVKISQIRAISFDGDMTLWDFEKVMWNSLGHALTELRARFPASGCADVTVDPIIEIRNTVADEFKGKRVTLERVRLAAFIMSWLLTSIRSISNIALQTLSSTHTCCGCWTPSPAGYLVGLVSNGNSYPERCGLHGRFTFVIFAQNVDVEKPDPAIFQQACREACCSPEQLMHIGVSLTTDVEGAQRAGAVSVWLNRDRKPNRTGMRPDHEIHSLIELENLLVSAQDAIRKTVFPQRSSRPTLAPRRTQDCRGAVCGGEGVWAAPRSLFGVATV